MLVALAAGVLAVSGSAVYQVKPMVTSASAPSLVIVAGEQTLLSVPVRRYARAGRLDASALTALVRRGVPQTASLRRGRARITYRYDRSAIIRRAIAAGRDGGTVEAVRRPVASHIAAPVLKQAQRNSCESAALQVLLASQGRNVDQLRLQRAFPRSGPLDPIEKGSSTVWGDPDAGFVGRPDGGGSAGGFGIYPGPVLTTARRFGIKLESFSGRSPRAVYARVLAGRAVMLWVGLSAGPYGQWRSPEGKTIKVNFGEHTVVAHGLRADGLIEISNPLEGTRELWTKSQFQAIWQLLGRRALAAQV